MIDLIDIIANNEKCRLIYKEVKLDYLKQLNLPEDVIRFYSYCDGAILFEHTSYEIIILPSEEIKLANPIIIGELYEEDISSEWYTIAKDMNGEFITIDSNPKRRGYCYDSFWDRHGVPGECKVIAKSFSDMVVNLLSKESYGKYWLDDDFVSLGDAYDNIEDL